MPLLDSRLSEENNLYSQSYRKIIKFLAVLWPDDATSKRGVIFSLRQTEKSAYKSMVIQFLSDLI